MKPTLIALLLSAAMLTGNLTASAQELHPKFAAIHQQFYKQFPKTITFIQRTDIYRADTIFRTQTWYEAGRFPELFRIDFGDPKDGNAVIYKGDSTYNFRKSKLVKAGVDPNILIYLLGGMYFQSSQEVNQKLKADGFDLSKSYQTRWENRDVLVFGTAVPDSTKNQLWYDAKAHYLVRMINIKPQSRIECQFGNHQQTGKVWHEGFVKILINNQLAQTETYSNFKINVPLDLDFFNPSKFGTWHWLN